MSDATPAPPARPTVTPHPRDENMIRAGAELQKFFIEWSTRYSLDTDEGFYLMLTLLRGWAQVVCLAKREAGGG